MGNEERHGDREMMMSSLHRVLGSRLTMSDLDCLEIEHNRPVALFEWKKGLDTRHDNWQRKPFIYVADMCKVPFYCLRYNSSGTIFSIEPLNKYDRIIKGIKKEGKKDLCYFYDGRLVCNIKLLKAIICVLHGKNPNTVEIDYLVFKNGPFSGQHYSDVYAKHIVDVNRISDDDIDISSIIESLK
jgi:hypothetical protein